MRLRRQHVVLIYNSLPPAAPESADDRGGMTDLKVMMRRMARVMRTLGHRVTVLPLAQDLWAFQRRLRHLKPDVVFNQYDDTVHGALYEMRVAAMVRLMGFPLTGSSALALGLSRYKYMAASLLQGAGIPIPPNTRMLERIGDTARFRWQFPVIVQASQEHAGIGLDRESVVHNRKALRAKVKHILEEYRQPALVQRFLPGREFNVGILGGRRPTILPLSEVCYNALPPDIPPIMSYAAKWLENTVEYKSTSVVCPAVVDPRLARRLGQVSLRAFRAVNGWGYGRVDIRLDERGEPRVLEVNCNPSLDEDVALARSASAANISYPELLQSIIKAALEGPPFDVDVQMM